MKYFIVFLILICPFIFFGQSKDVEYAINHTDYTLKVVDEERLSKSWRVKRIEKFFNKKKNKEQYLLLDIKPKLLSATRPYHNQVVYSSVLYVSSYIFVLREDLEGGADYYTELMLDFIKSDSLNNALGTARIAIALETTDIRPYLLLSAKAFEENPRLYRQYMMDIKAKGIDTLSNYWLKCYHQASAEDYWDQKKYEESARQYEKALRYGENLEYGTNNYWDYFLAGWAQYRSHDNDYYNGHKYSIKHFLKSIEKDSTFKTAYYFLGYAYDKVGEHALAIEAFTKTLTVKDNARKYGKHIKINPLYKRGVAYLKNKNPNSAIADLNHFLNRVSSDHEYAKDANFMLGLAYGYVGKDKEMDRYIIRAGNLGNKVAIQYASLYIKSSKWYQERQMGMVIMDMVGRAAGHIIESNAAYSSPEAVRARMLEYRKTDPRFRRN